MVYKLAEKKRSAHVILCMRVFLVKENVFIPAKVVNLCALIIFMFLQLILYFHMLLNCSTNGFLIISAEIFFCFI